MKGKNAPAVAKCDCDDLQAATTQCFVLSAIETV